MCPAGSTDPALFFITEGAVKMTTTSSHGRSLVLHVFHPGSCFPLLTLVNEGVNAYDLIALTPVVLHKVHRDQFLGFLKKHPDLLLDFQVRLLRGLQGLLKRIERSAFVPAYNQVAGLLLYFARHFSEMEAKSPVIEIRITHQDIAEWLGLSRENVSLQVKKLERNGLIRKKNALIEILNMSELTHLADEYASP